MRVLGIDLGSREVKIVLMEDNKIIQKKKVSTMNFYRNYCDFDGKIVVNLEKLDMRQIHKAVLQATEKTTLIYSCSHQ